MNNLCGTKYTCIHNGTTYTCLHVGTTYTCVPAPNMSHGRRYVRGPCGGLELIAGRCPVHEYRRHRKRIQESQALLGRTVCGRCRHAAIRAGADTGPGRAGATGSVMLKSGVDVIYNMVVALEFVRDVRADIEKQDAELKRRRRNVRLGFVEPVGDETSFRMGRQKLLDLIGRKYKEWRYEAYLLGASLESRCTDLVHGIAVPLLEELHVDLRSAFSMATNVGRLELYVRGRERILKKHRVRDDRPAVEEEEEGVPPREPVRTDFHGVFDNIRGAIDAWMEQQRRSAALKSQ